jgi:nitroreductase
MQDRPDPPNPTPHADAASLARLLGRRFSCRGFRADPVPHDTILRILDLAQRTASWNNVQPWSVIVTEGEGTERFRRELLAHVESSPRSSPDLAFPREYREPYLARRRECGFALYAAVGVARGDKAAYARQTRENFRLFGAPHVALISTDEALGTYGALDCGAYVGNFMLAAQAFGVASIAQAALATYSPFLRAYFALADEQRVVCGISFGYADMSHKANGYRTTRLDPKETVRFVSA